MALTEVAIKAAKPAEKPYKVADEKGLYLLVNPGGSKLWRFKCWRALKINQQIGVLLTEN